MAFTSGGGGFMERGEEDFWISVLRRRLKVLQRTAAVFSGEQTLCKEKGGYERGRECVLVHFDILI